MFYEVVLVTRKKNFCKNFRVSNSNCDVILHNSILQLRNFETQLKGSRILKLLLKVVSAIFLLVSFVCLKESTLEKGIFLFHFKSSFRS